MGWLDVSGESLPALGFLQGAAQLGDAAARLPFGAELPTLIGKQAQMRGRFRAKRIKATRKFGAIFGRIGNKARRRLLRQGGG
jgi:hypothetical protein